MYNFNIGLIDEKVLQNLENSPIEKLIVTNSTKLNVSSSKIVVISVGPLVAEIIRRQYLNESLRNITYY